MSKPTATAKSLKYQCPKCRAEPGKRCWNLYRVWPGGQLRSAEARQYWAKRGKPVGRPHKKSSHKERI